MTEQRPIASITIGNRRREDMGDIDALAASIQRYGLIHPIVIDATGRLIAGGRRLAACQQLRWTDVDVRPYGALSENERREIELEENLLRKDLTAAERTRVMHERVEVVSAIIEEEAADVPSLVGNSPDRPAGPPAKTVTQAKIAERMGVDQKTISNVQRHMQALQKYPRLEIHPQDTAIKAAAAFDRYPELPSVVGDAANYAVKIATNLDELPEDKRGQERAALQQQDQRTLARLAGLPEPESMSEEEREIERKYKVARRWGKAYVELSAVCTAIRDECAAGDGWDAMDRRNILSQVMGIRRELEEVYQLLEKGE